MRLVGRKGFIGDAAYVVAILFVLSLVAVVGFKFYDDFDDKYQASDTASDKGKEISSDLSGRYVSLWDGIFMLVFGLLAIGLLISVASLGTRPEFFFIVIIISLFVVGGAALLSNVFTDATAGDLAASAAQFSFATLVMSNLPMIAVALVVLLLAGLFVKIRGVV